MAKMSGPSDMSVQNPAIHHGCSPDSRSESQHEHVADTPSGAKPGFAKQCSLGVIKNLHRSIEFQQLIPIKPFKAAQAPWHKSDATSVCRDQPRGRDPHTERGRTFSRDTRLQLPDSLQPG